MTYPLCRPTFFHPPILKVYHVISPRSVATNFISIPILAGYGRRVLYIEYKYVVCVVLNILDCVRLLMFENLATITREVISTHHIINTGF